jgi:hypothetical protein
MIRSARRNLFAHAATKVTGFRFLEDVDELLAVEDADPFDVAREFLAALRISYRMSYNIERTPSSLPRIPVANIPFAKKFAVATQQSVYMRPDFFVAAFCFDGWTTVAKQATEWGKTALHWALSSWSHTRGHEPNHYATEVISSYANVVIELVRNGADIHACWDSSLRWGVTSKASPLLTLLSDTSKFRNWHAASASISDAVYRWGLMLVEAGKSLTNYVFTENKFLRAKHRAIYALGGYEFFVIGLKILAGNRLTVRVEQTFEVSVWKARPTHMPGAWSSPLRLPDTIIWRPDDADEQEGFHWVPAEAVNIGKYSYLVGPLDTIESHALDSISLREPQDIGVRYSATQDDHNLSLVTMTNDDEFRQDIKT